MKKEYLLKIVDLLEIEFDRLRCQNFDGDSKIYEYLEDLKTVIKNLKK